MYKKANFLYISVIKNLITLKDIRDLEKKSRINVSLTIEEACILQQKSFSESRIQQTCKDIFRAKFGVGFIQIDNGCPSLGMRLRKGREGTVSGFPDVMLIGKNKVIFVEFKRINSPAAIEPKPEQKKQHEFLKACGFQVFTTNNTVFFEREICGYFKF